VPSPDSDKRTCMAVDLDIQEVTAVDVGARHMAQSLVSIDKLFKEASTVLNVKIVTVP
jgi:hypothetical protein